MSWASRPAVEREGQQLVERLGGRWGTAGGLCRCPAHDDRTPSLSVRPGRTRLLFHCFAGCGIAEILAALQRERLLAPAAALRPSTVSRERRIEAVALRLWDEARPIAGTLADAYLASRGLAGGSPDLRYHPRVPDGPGPARPLRPAMIAAVRDESGLVAIHRTFLAPGARGRAPIASSRRGLGRFRGGAVRLGGAGVRLGLAEGIETALSATILFGIPCWATLGSERFGGIALGREVRELHLFLDHDSGGRRAERRARAAYGGLVRIEDRRPPSPGQDWNDVLRSS